MIMMMTIMFWKTVLNLNVNDDDYDDKHNVLENCALLSFNPPHDDYDDHFQDGEDGNYSDDDDEANSDSILQDPIIDSVREEAETKMNKKMC